MMMKVFPHGKGAGGNPTWYLIRTDYPGRDTHPPQILRGDPAMTRALINSIDRRWKFTAGVLAWHPDDRVNMEQEQAVMDDFEKIAFVGLEPDQRNILWVRHTHAGHHELHFVIPRLELSSGKDFNACPPGWQKDFDVFRDMWNWSEGWARPDDPARARDTLPAKSDLFKARMARWGKIITPSERDMLKADIHAFLEKQCEQGQVQTRADVVRLLMSMGMHINRTGKDYLSIMEPVSGYKVRFRGGFYAENWVPKKKDTSSQQDEAEQEEYRKKMLIRLRQEWDRILEKRRDCNMRRYASRWTSEDEEFQQQLPPEEGTHNDRNGTDASADTEARGRTYQHDTRRFCKTAGKAGTGDEDSDAAIATVEQLVQRCAGYVQQLEQHSQKTEQERIDDAPPTHYRIRM